MKRHRCARFHFLHHTTKKLQTQYTRAINCMDNVTRLQINQATNSDAVSDRAIFAKDTFSLTATYVVD